MPRATALPRRLQANGTSQTASQCNQTCVRMPGNFTNYACRRPLKSGENVTCISDSVFSLQYACLADFKMKCPKLNHGNATMPFLVRDAGGKSPVRCQACGTTPLTRDNDMDPTPKKYWVKLQWGMNMIKPEGGASFYEKYISGYHIVIVDENGLQVADTGFRTPKMEFLSSCCDPKAYSITVRGDWPETGHSFMILPYQLKMGKEYRMPMGTMIKFDDKMEGQITSVKGSLTMKNMTQADAVEFANHPDSKKIVQKGIVAADTEGKLKEDNVVVTALTAMLGSRRLSTARLLQGLWSVKADYEIILPTGYSEFTASSLNSTALLDTIQKEANKSGMNITVGEIEVADPVVSEVGEAIITGAASPMAGIFFSVALALALAGRQFFA